MTEPVKARLHVTDALSAGGTVTLADDQVHYLRHVLRLEAGQAVALFNGRDGEFRAIIAEAGKKACRLMVEALLRPQAPGPILESVVED